MYFESVMEGRIEAPLSWLLTPPGERIVALDNPDQTVRELYREYQKAVEPYGGSNEALDDYKGFDHEEINYYLRNNGKQNAEIDSQIRSLDTFLENRQVDRARLLYRVITTGNVSPEKYAKNLARNETYCDSAFMSTSANPEFVASIAAGNYAHWTGPRLIFEIATRGGVSSQSFPELAIENFGSKENEVLLPRNRKFKIVGFEERELQFDQFLTHCEGEWCEEAKKTGSVRCMVIQLVDCE